MRTAPLDILYVGMLPPHPGGSGISWAQVLRGLTQLGHSVRALAPITPAALAAGDAFAGDHPELRVTRFLVPHFYTGPNIPASEEYRRLEHEQIEAQLTTMITDQLPDIIIIGRESFALHVPDIARSRSIPSLLGIRGNTAIAILNGTYPPDLAEVMLAQFRKATLMVSVARHMAEGLERLGLTNIKVIPNSVDLTLFSPKPKDVQLQRGLAIQDDDVIVVHASNLKAAKRPLDLVISAELALRQCPKLVYVVVGDGEYRQAMENACRLRRILERFRFVGWVTNSRVPDYINLADLVLSPSQSEGLSRVYLETQACARLLVASDIAAAREVIVHGESGLLFRTGDIEDMTIKTLDAVRDPRRRADIGRKALERVQAHDLKRIVSAYVSTFEDCLRQPRPTDRPL